MPSLRLADYVVKTLADRGVKHVFLVTGGGAMHLNDAFCQEKRIEPIFNHHEQACAMAAEGYARIKNKMGVINVTTGPGGLNALNGVFGAFTDSIPMLVISGQVKTETKKSAYPDLALRQLGDQEVDIISVVRPITKYAVAINNVAEIRHELEKALFLAENGRPGPVWIDIPVDLQATQIIPEDLHGYEPTKTLSHQSSGPELEKQVDEVIRRLHSAKRPTLLVGNGVRLSHSIDLLNKLGDELKIPLCPAWMMDFVPADHPYFCGIQGTIGDRAGNFVVQNSDLLLILGSRLQIRQISYNWLNFAREAYKIHVDIDFAELNKPTLKNDLPICADLREFLQLLTKKLEGHRKNPDHEKWLEWAKIRKETYHPVHVTTEQKPNGIINPYRFFERLSSLLDTSWNIVAGNASACVMSFPTFKLKQGQRVFTNAGSASMGYDLPAALGAAIADPNRKTLCLAGDGSIMMNIQELQTVAQYKPDLKILVINNDGYLSIRSTQKGFFGRPYGESSASGLSLPNFHKLAQAFDLPAQRLEKMDDFDEALKEFLTAKGPALLEVMVDPEQPFEPKLSSKKLPDGKMVSAPLEDMWPFLPRDEFMTNMIVPVLPESKT